MEKSKLFLMVVFIISIFLLSGCISGTTYEESEPRTTKSSKKRTKEEGIRSKKSSWLEVELLKIKENQTHLTFDFKLRNMGEKDVRNVIYPNGPDEVSIDASEKENLRFNFIHGMDTDKTKTTFIKSETGFCDYFPNEKEPNCNPLEVYAVFKKPKNNEEFILRYFPGMWYQAARRVIFYIEKRGGEFISVSKEEYFNVNIEREESTPQLSYWDIEDMRSLSVDLNTDICTQNFWGNELAYCLTKLSRTKMDPSICEAGENRYIMAPAPPLNFFGARDDWINSTIEYTCKNRFLDFALMTKKISEKAKKKGLNLVSICKELPKDNREIGRHESNCFYEIGRVGYNKTACNYTEGLSSEDCSGSQNCKESCLDLYGVNSN